jgi:peptidyl-tRNA hydrolase, PTH1 family
VLLFLEDREHTLKRARQGIRAEVCEIALEGRRVTFALPTTFMNKSGQAIAPLVRYYGIASGNILVVYDDIDVPFARLKMQWAGGHGGNNGVRSVAGSLKSDDFWRLKLGVGRPPGRVDPADFVLGRFGASERVEIDVTIARAMDVIERFIVAGGEDARQFAGELND